MFTKPKTELLIASITAAAMIAFAFYQRHLPVPASSETFFYAAAIICISPAVYALAKCRISKARKSVRVG